MQGYEVLQIHQMSVYQITLKLVCKRIIIPTFSPRPPTFPPLVFLRSESLWISHRFMSLVKMVKWFRITLLQIMLTFCHPFNRNLFSNAENYQFKLEGLEVNNGEECSYEAHVFQMP